MAIVWLILKILGCILATLLGIVLLLVVVALFVPVRYRLYAVKEAEGDVAGKARIRYLFPLLYVKMEFQDKEFHYSLRLLGIPFVNETGILWHMPAWLKRRHSKRKSKKEKPIRTANQSDSKDVPDINVTEPADTIEKQNTRMPESVSELPREKPQSIHWYQRLYTKWLAIMKFFVTIKETFCHLFTNIRGVITFLTDVHTQAGLRIAKSSVLELLCYVLPVRIRGRLTIGLDDPSETAFITGLLSLVYVKSQGRIEIEPDFEHMVIEGEFYGRGRIRLVRLIRIAWKLWRNKEFKQLIKGIRSRG